MFVYDIATIQFKSFENANGASIFDRDICEWNDLLENDPCMKIEDLRPMIQFRIEPMDVDALYPCPWDAGFHVDGEKCIIRGGANACGYGSCIVEIPASHACTIFRIEIDLFDVSKDFLDKIVSKLKDLGIGFEFSELKIKSIGNKNLEKILESNSFGVKIKDLKITSKILDILLNVSIEDLERLSMDLDGGSAMDNSLFMEIDLALDHGITDINLEIIDKILKSLILDLKS